MKKHAAHRRNQSIHHDHRRFIVVAVTLLFVFALVLAHSLQSGSLRFSPQPIQEARTVEPFNRLSIRGMGTVTIQQGEEPRLFVMAPEGIMDSIDTFVADNTLFIEFDRKGSWWRSFRLNISDISFIVQAHDIIEIAGSGSSEIQTHGVGVVGDTLRVSLGGSSRAVLNVDVDWLHVIGKDAATYIITGRAEAQDIELSGTSRYFAKDAKGSEAVLNAAGANEVELGVDDRLDVTLATDSVLRYYGEPEVTKEVVEGASVQHIEK